MKKKLGPHREPEIPRIDSYQRFLGNLDCPRGGTASTSAAQSPSGNKMPLVSIVTVVLNGEDTVERAMNSVFAQSYPNVEYIVVDGGSRDGTLGIVRKHEGRISSWISHPDQGISDAFNRGIGLAKGDIVGILNADDWYEPDTVRWAVEAFLSEAGPDVVCGWVQYWQGAEKGYLFTSNPELLDREMSINHPSVFVRRSVYETHGLFLNELRYAMDYELMLRFKCRGTKFFSLERVLANMSLDGVSDKNWKKGLAEVKLAKEFNLGPSLSLEYAYYRQMMRSALARFFEKAGLSGVTAFYRKRFAKLKKIAP